MTLIKWKNETKLSPLRAQYDRRYSLNSFIDGHPWQSAKEHFDSKSKYSDDHMIKVFEVFVENVSQQTVGILKRSNYAFPFLIQIKPRKIQISRFELWFMSIYILLLIAKVLKRFSCDLFVPHCDSFPMNREKKTLIPYIYNASNKNPF